MSYDLVIQNARIVGDTNTVSLAVNEDTIVEIDSDLSDATTVIEANNGVIVDGFVDAHTHLDKAYAGTARGGEDAESIGAVIENMQAVKANATVEGVRDRAIQGIKSHVQHGCTRIRTHVDVDAIGGLVNLKGVLAAREACSPIADVQVVAFPQEGLYGKEGSIDLLAAALDEGADIVGGMPQLERTEAAQRDHVDDCLKLAQDHDSPLDLHIDETDDPSARSLEYLAARCLDTGFDHTVTASHACALASYDDAHAARVIDLVAEAGLNVITNPATNLIHQGGYDSYPKRRGLTRVDELKQAGVVVAAAQDNISDGFYPYGRGDMVEVASLAAHALQLATPSERQSAIELVSTEPAKIVGGSSGITTGAPATFVLFPPSVATATDVLRAGVPPRAVFHRGQLVAENTVESIVKSATDLAD